MIRVVLDTNQIVSMAIRPGGVQDQIRAAWRERQFLTAREFLKILQGESPPREG